MSMIDEFGNFVDFYKELWNDFRADAGMTLEYQYQRAMEYLGNQYVHDQLSGPMFEPDPAVLEELAYQEIVVKRYIEEIVSRDMGTPGSLVYNANGDMVGGYNYDGEYCSIGELVL